MPYRRLASAAFLTVTAMLSGASAIEPVVHAPRTLVGVLAHADDETPVAPLLARYAREGVRVHLVVVSDGREGAGQQGHIPRPDGTATGDALATVRLDEARCAARALGAQPPVLLGFPDGRLGDYRTDRSLVYRLTERIAGELQRLRADVVLTWGPDGGTGHPDHRLVSSIVTQLQRAGAPGVPERLFYMSLPVEVIQAMNPQRGAPPLLVPRPAYFTTRVGFAPEDFAAATRSMACHRTQFSDDVVERVSAAAAAAWHHTISLIPASAGAPAAGLFE